MATLIGLFNMNCHRTKDYFMMFPPRSKSIGKDNFVKLNHKESVVGIFTGNIYQFKRHWSNGRSAECTGSGCTLCAEGAKKDEKEKDRFPAFRFRMNFITDALVAKVFEGSSVSYDLLTALDEKFDLSKTFIKITRYGVKNTTTYEFEAIEKPIPDSVKAKLDAVPRLALS